MVTLCKSKVDNVKYAIKKVPIGLEEEYIGLEDESTGLLTKKGPDCDYATLVRYVKE